MSRLDTTGDGLDDGLDDGDEFEDDELARLERRAALAAPNVPQRSWGVGLVVLGTLGLAAAFTLTLDKFRILEDPTFTPACDLNPVLSCGSVMVTDQAEVFGFPNPIIGIGAFAVVITLAVLLALGTRLPRPVLAGLALGAAAGTVFVHWLAFQSLYRINALCPWCMVVWSVTIPIAVWSLLHAVAAYRPGRAVTAGWRWRYLIVLSWYLAFAVAIAERFWDYWRTLL